MKHPISFCKLFIVAAVVLPTLALAEITPVLPTLDNTDNCYMIGSAEELYGFAEMVNGTDEGFSGCGKLTADICVNACGEGESVFNANGTLNGSSFTPWTPMNVKSGVQVTLKGDGRTISGLYFNDDAKSDVGLFGEIRGSVSISELGIKDSYFKGSDYVGGLVGYNSGTLIITNSHNEGTVSGTAYVGGLVGDYNGGSLSIENSYNEGTVSGEGKVGGLVGYSSGILTITNSYNVGPVSGKNYVGGLVGYSYNGTLTITNSYNSGSVSGNIYVGGLVGYSYNGTLTITNSFFLATGGSGDDLGGEVRIFDDFHNGIVALLLHNYVQADCEENCIDGSVWGLDVTKENSLPDLSGEFVGGTPHTLTLNTFTDDTRKLPTIYLEGLVLELPTDLTRKNYVFLGWSAKETAESFADIVTSIAKGETGAKEFYAQWMKVNEKGCYEIGTAFELYGFANVVNNATDGNKVCGKLTKDIVVNTGVLNTNGVLNGAGSNFTPWTPMNVKSGVQVAFDGAGKTISGLYFKDGNTNYVGLFGDMMGELSISDLGVNDSYFKGRDLVGGLVGFSDYGGTLTITNSYNSGTVSGDNNVGGLVGRNGGSLTIENSYNVGAMPGKRNVGGLVGRNSGVNAKLTITNSYNARTVSGVDVNVGGLVGYSDHTLTITNSYSTGHVSGPDYVGGLLGGNGGKNAKLPITNSFFLATGKSGDNYGGTGKSADEFHNGTVALLLRNYVQTDCEENCVDGSVWGQNVGQASDNDAAPTLSGVLKLGPLTVAKDAAGKDSAAIDGNSALEVKIPADIHVDYVKFNRTFTPGVVATIVLPFDVPSSALPGNAEFGTLKSVGPNSEKGGKWEAVFNKVTELEAHTPYLVRLTGGTSLDFDFGEAGGTSLDFDFGEAGGTIKTTEEYDEVSGKMVTVPTSSTSTDEQWELVGTYSYKSWQEGDPGIGSTYGFAGSAEGENVVAGQFVKVGAGAYINPMRVYLKRVESSSSSSRTRRALGNASVLASIPEELPEYIDVVFVDSDDAADANEVAAGSDSAAEKTTYIGRINTRTGEFKFADDRWFDLDGRYLGNKKPTQKGAYYNNGKKVIVK